LFQRASTIQIQLSLLVQYKGDITTSSRHDIAGKLLIWH
jgi:hypothetical protein